MRSFALWLGLPSPIPHVPAQAAGLRRMLRSGLAVLFGSLLLIAGRPVFSADKPLVFGVFPHLTAKQIVETYRPIADTLEKHLQREVIIYSARDFKTFVERTRQGDYDILLTAPHLAWLARRDAGYRPLLKYAQPVYGLLVVRIDSPYKEPKALRGHTIATPDPFAVAVLALHAELATQGLRHGIDYRTVASGSHRNAVMQVINDRTDGAMLGQHTYTMLPPELRQQLRVLAKTAPLSSLMYLTHPRLRDAESQAIRKALLQFASLPEGRAFMRDGGYAGLVDVDGGELQSFHPYALQVQDLLRETR